MLSLLAVLIYVGALVIPTLIFIRVARAMSHALTHSAAVARRSAEAARFLDQHAGPTWRA